MSEELQQENTRRKIEKPDVLSLNFYKKEAFQGSCDGIRYQLHMVTEEEEKKLEVIIWPEPYGIASTPNEKKQRRLFDFDGEGLDAALDWLNEMQPTIKNLGSDVVDTDPIE